MCTPPNITITICHDEQDGSPGSVDLAGWISEKEKSGKNEEENQATYRISEEDDHWVRRRGGCA